MNKVRILNEKEIKSIIKIDDIIDAVEDGYLMKAKGLTEIFPILTQDLIENEADFDIKSGSIAGNNIYGMKTVSYFANNYKLGIPNLIGVLSIYNLETGEPIGILDASYITCLRTGAAGAVGVKYLAKEEATSALIIGAGKQAIYQIASLLKVKTNIEKIHVFDPKSLDNAKKFVSSISSILQKEFNINSEKIEFIVVHDIEEAVRKNDIIITVTPSKEPIVKNEWVNPGTHFSCIGSDTVGKQEIDANIMKRARIFVDDVKQCVRVGEIEKAINLEIITKEDIISEIGSLIEGKTKGRISENDITVFDSTGIAVQDLVAAKMILDVAEKNNIGQMIEL